MQDTHRSGAPGGAFRGALRVGSTLVLAVIASLTVPASVAGVARWVDARGITTFGDPQLAPSLAEVEAVEIHPANGMVPAVMDPNTAAGQGPRIIRLGLPGKRNKKGWRGDESL